MRALQRTPKRLEEQCLRILRHIFEDHDEDWREIQALLTWTALAFVPLTLPQLARAVMGSVTREHRERIKDLLIYCDHLFVINDKTGVVRFVHTSIKELLSQPHPMIPVSSVTHGTHVDNGHRIIMRTCLKILERTSQSDVLKQYAVEFLPRHMEACTAPDISRELSRPYFVVENILQSHWEEWRRSQWNRKFFPEVTPSPLHIATYWGVIPWAQHQLRARSIWDILLRRSHLESKDACGLTPLAIAVRDRNVPMVEWLLQQGATVDLELALPEDAKKHGCYDTRGKSPLVLAFQVDDLHDTLEDWLESETFEIASLLLSHLNKPTWRSIRQSRAMIQVMDTSSQVPAQWLLDLYPPPPKVSRTHFNCPALAMAVRMRHVEILRQLLDRGADIYSSWEAGRTALADAIQVADSTEQLERMLNLLFDAYDKRISTSGRFELVGAVLLGHVEQVLILLRHGANVNAVGRHGDSILTLAMQCGIWDMAELLLSHGAEVNFVGRAGITPLTEAVREKVTEKETQNSFETSRIRRLYALENISWENRFVRGG
ncbi:hypothetical protein PG996_007907 [Apiospora saccharicola]|uniref:Ankyrin n=1 Tax=Apiospora saccharicola TaxID=335842 RepID=A0ABR1UWE4_9PEZI